MHDAERQRRLGFTQAAEAYARGRMGRREFLRVSALAGFGVLAGCRPRRGEANAGNLKLADTTGPLSAIDPQTEQHKFLRSVGRGFAGATLRIVSEDTPPSRVTRELARQEFVALTGINIEWEQLPLDRVLAKVSADTARQAGTHDIFYIDQSWVSKFAGDTVDPRTLLAKKDFAYPGYNFSDILTPLVRHVASDKERIVGIPYDIPIYIMMYRRDVFEQLKLAPPTTFPEYMEAAKTVHEAMAPRMYGTCGQWKAGHYSLECDMTMFLWGHGGSVYGADRHPRISDERATAAMEYMLQLGRYMPPAVTTWDWFGQSHAFAQGEVAFYTSWGEFFPEHDSPARSKIVGLAEPAPCPQPIALRPASECGFGETPGASHQGGSSLAISRHGKQVDAAWIFLQWATSSDVTSRACILGGGASPIRRSNYEDPRVKARAKVMTGTTRHLEVTLDAILNRMGTEPHLPDWPALSVESFAMELGKMVTGQQNVKTTLANMARDAEAARLQP